MMFFDKIFGWIDRPGSGSEDPLEEIEQETLADRVKFLEKHTTNLDDVLEYDRGRMDNLVRRINKIDDRLNTLEGSDPDRKWYQDNEYVKTFCPKCKHPNTTKVPVKAKNSMGLTCDNCGIDYRILFEIKDE